MHDLTYLLAFLLSSGVVHAQNATSPIVTLSYGTFEGSSSPLLEKFLGIPFGIAGRFELPRTPSHLPGIQQATAFGPACPQQSSPIASVPGIPDLSSFFNTTVPLTMSENCLFVNVIKPSFIPPGVKLPVLFWIYGGGFEEGDTSLNDGSTVVARSIALGEPIIYVSANYRISAYGFSASKEIQAAGLGNLGLRDQRFAMEWVQTNIEKFGGDNAKVTIWGQSAGAISVGLHLIVNGGNQGSLFRSAVMESGSPLPLTDITAGQVFFDQLIAATGCTGSKDVLACLKAVPFDTFQNAVNESPNLFSFTSLQLVWQPRVDGEFIKENPQDSIAQGAFSKVPLINGDCDDEGTLFSLSTLNLTTDQEAANFLHSNYYPKASNAEFDILAVFYPSNPTVGSPFNTGDLNALTPQFKRIAAFQGDFEFQAPRRFFLQAASKRQNVWSYTFKRSKATPFFGALHGSDIAEFYGSLATPSFQGTDALVNFANTGNPNMRANPGAKTISSLSMVNWPMYSTSRSAPPLLEFLEGTMLNITTDTFRILPIQAMTALSRLFP
ncbi:hypothetical protein M422DRAFT_230113 [Sphaerobolus stellatus SS14]|uniref:Carboxylic ester hydrolase n=1 Tax=Sphaerobolus stellatus (strain SS14) TaxID=990650 RepID=A0A0C9VQN5_SPHS4|nr:hypothetical protein M422DRAFT_230113 [Sphaerobolus stellatus SS14]